MSMVAQVQVEYGRTVSDGSFGAERVGVTLTATVEAGDNAVRVAHDLASRAKEIVTEELRKARSYTVRHTVTNEDPWPEQR